MLFVINKLFELIWILGSVLFKLIVLVFLDIIVLIIWVKFWVVDNFIENFLLIFVWIVLI